MKYRIYRYAKKNSRVENIKKEIFTNDIEVERKKLEELHPGYIIHLYYEHLNERYE